MLLPWVLLNHVPFEKETAMCSFLTTNFSKLHRKEAVIRSFLSTITS